MLSFYYKYVSFTNKDKLSLTHSKCTSTIEVINIISYTQLYGNLDNYMDDDYKAECLNPSSKFTIPLPCH